MQKQTLKTLWILVVVTGMVGAGSVAFAKGGWMMGRGYDQDRGMGRYQNQDDYCYGYGRADLNLTDAQIQQVENERIAYLKATDDLRDELFYTQIDLNRELEKAETNTQKAVDLQKKISELKTQLDQKRLEHLLALKKIDPELVKGTGRFGHMMGYGGHMMGYGGHMMGQGHGGSMYGGGYCR